MEARHFDDTPDNNVLENLSWGTRGDNLLDAVRNGKKPVGADHPCAKLTEDQAATVKALKGRARACDLARILNVTPGVPRMIWLERAWKSVAPMEINCAVEVIYGAQR